MSELAIKDIDTIILTTFLMFKRDNRDVKDKLGTIVSDDLKKSIALNGVNQRLDIPKEMASDLEDLVIETIQNKRKVTQKDK